MSYTLEPILEETSYTNNNLSTLRNDSNLRSKKIVDSIAPNKDREENK